MKHTTGLVKLSGMVAVLMLFALAFSLPMAQASGSRAQATDEVMTAATDDATLDATATAEPTPEPVDLANGLKIENKHTENHIDKPPLDEEVDQPVMSGATGDTVDNFNKAVDDIIKSSVDSFANDEISAEATATLPPDVGGGTSSFVYTRYEVLNGNKTSNILSIKFNVFWYSRGAAHPNSYSVPLNYDLKNAKVIELANLFKPKANYVKVLSDYSTADLKKRDRLDFPEGALPDPNNFRSWNITPDGLQITFDDYQVTPHAVGPQTVVVPYATLKTLIDPAGPLAEFVK